MKPRTAATANDRMTTKQKRTRKRAADLARYHEQMADPAFRADRARKERERWARGEGARRNALEREVTAKVQAYRAANPPPPKPPTREQQEGPDRVAAKRAWYRAHADALHARRKAARLANPEKYRLIEQASKRRKRELARLIEKPLLSPSKLLPGSPQ